jgi:YfiH family protein
MVTTLAKVALVVRVADCVPVLLADRQARVIGVAHAGRAGLLGGILEQCLAVMANHGAEQIQAWIGPHICAGCYEVPPDMAEKAWQAIPATESRSKKDTPAIDLGAGAEAILVDRGVQVTCLDPCTSCDPRFFSHRRDRGQTGRQAGVIWLENP